jgi:hypothetical protein
MVDPDPILKWIPYNCPSMVTDTVGAPTSTLHAREAKQPKNFKIPPDVYTQFYETFNHSITATVTHFIKTILSGEQRDICEKVIFFAILLS